jgi:ribonuclease HI
VVRDDHGKLIRAQARWFEYAANDMVMEAYAIREGLRLAADVGYQSIIVESDVKEVVKLCNSEDQDNSEISPIYQEIRDMIGAFISCNIVFVGREDNQAAHLCVRHASSDRKRCI